MIYLYGNVNMGGRGFFNNNVNKSMVYWNDMFNSDFIWKVVIEEKFIFD